MLISGGNFHALRVDRFKKFGASRTRQSEAKDADINVIVDRFLRTGQIPIVDRPPLSGDFSKVGNFSDAMDMVVKAQRSFESLPAKLREKFGNDPAAFVQFMESKPSADMLVEYGILFKEVVDVKSAGDVGDASGGKS